MNEWVNANVALKDLRYVIKRFKILWAYPMLSLHILIFLILPLIINVLFTLEVRFSSIVRHNTLKIHLFQFTGIVKTLRINQFQKSLF